MKKNEINKRDIVLSKLEEEKYDDHIPKIKVIVHVPAVKKRITPQARVK